MGSTANTPPTVSITSPSNGATFTAPASITINATASDSDGTVAQVQFFQGATLLGTDTTAPYSFSWSNVAAGSYSLTARATDNSGATTTSIAVNITVNAAANVPPTVSIASPSNNAVFTAPASITINAVASDSDGTLTRVEFFQGATKLGEDTTAPYSYSWTNVAAGSYSLTAKATDNSGAVTTSAAVSVGQCPRQRGADGKYNQPQQWRHLHGAGFDHDQCHCQRQRRVGHAGAVLPGRHAPGHGHHRPLQLQLEQRGGRQLQLDGQGDRQQRGGHYLGGR